MKNREQFQFFAPNAIGNKIRSAGNYQLARPGNTSWPTNVRLASQQINGSQYFLGN